jgi:mannosylglycerate hydrolase
MAKTTSTKKSECAGDCKCNAQRVTGHIITHNHWDRDWVLTDCITRGQAEAFFDNLFEMLEREPDYKMVTDGQAEVIDDYMEHLPAKKRKALQAKFRKWVAKGNIAVGPTYIQPDYVLISGETHVRNLLIGHKIGKSFGKVMKAGWLVDTFGHISQTPQLLTQFGIDGIFIARGFSIPPEEIMSEFTWSGPDGSTLLAVYTMNTTRNAMNLAQMPKIAENRIDIEMEKLTPLCFAPHVPLINGFEQDEIIDDILPIVRKINKKGKDYDLKQTHPDEFLELIRPHLKGKKLPHCEGFLYSGIYMPLLHGTLSTRMPVKLRNDQLEKACEKWAEPFGAFTWSRGDKYPAEEIERCWKLLLQNDHHDDICGCNSDNVDIDMHKRYDRVEKISGGVIADKLERIACNVDTQAVGDDGVALVIFNPANHERNDVTRAVVELPEKFDAVKVVDAAGKVVPMQILSVRGKKVELAFRATLASLGHTTVFVKPLGKSKVPAAGGLCVDEKKNVVENKFLKIKINANGTVDVTHKKTGKTYSQCGKLVDGGDMGDVYDYSYPPQELLVSSADCDATITCEQAGPLVARFRVEYTMRIPDALHKNRKERTKKLVDMPVVSFIELAADSKRVEWTTSLTNTAKNHRVRVHFPTGGIKSDYSWAGESFDVNRFTYLGELWGIDLPKRLTGLVVPGRDTIRITSYPFHGFCDYNDGKTGAAALARGIREYEVVKPSREIALTLLRSVGWMTHLDILTRNGDVGWEIYTPMAQCFGTHTFEYGFCPHEGDWFAGGVHTERDLYVEPVTVVQSGAHDGKLAKTSSFVTIKPADKLTFSSIKRSEDGKSLIVRCFNPRATKVTGTIEVNAKVKAAIKSNVAEDLTGEALKKVGKGWQFSAGNREVVTLRFDLAEDKSLARKPAASLAKTVKACKRAMPVKMPSLDIELPPIVTMDDINSEKARLEKIKARHAALKVKVAKLKAKVDALAKQGKEDDDLNIEWSKQGHLLSLERRYIDEAKFSVLLTQRRWYEQTIKDPKKLKAKLEKNMEAIAKTELPELRIIGRLHEYVRQFYVSQKASRLGKGLAAMADEVTDAAMANTADTSMASRKTKREKKR